METLAVVAVCALLCVGCSAEISEERSNPGGLADPCEKVVCTKGRMCELAAGQDRRFTTCVCPEECPKMDPPAPVCSSYDTEFNSTCEMHKFICQFEIMMTIKNKGRCERIEELDGDRCPLDSLLQFHRRYLMYLMVAKAREEDSTFEYGDMHVDSLNDEEKKDIIQWEFKTRDLDKSGVLEMNEITWMVEKREGCMNGFLRSCDFDKKAGISKHEWEICFPPRIRVDTEDPNFLES